jgi:hypothetical protein
MTGRIVTIELLNIGHHERLSENNYWRIVLGKVHKFVPRLLNFSKVNRSSLGQSTLFASAG